MFKDLPEDVRMAFNILYNFADDSRICEMERKRADMWGLDIDGQSCHLITFAISKNRSWEDVV